MTRPRAWHSIPEYQAFRALMLAGTTTQAAAQLGLSQSAISRSIGSLESRVGTTLFERDSGRLRPTEEAVRLNRRLDPLFDALARIDGPAEPVRETLRLIAPPSYAHRFLVGQISGFLKANPHFFISLDVNASDALVGGILEDRFDLGIAGVELSRAGVKVVPYRIAQAVCVLPKSHPLAGRDTIRPADLHDQPLIALSHRHARRAQLDRLLREHRAMPRLKAEVSTTFAAADLVRNELGLAILNPFPLYHYRGRDVVFAPFESPIRYHSYFVLSGTRPVPRIARAFMRYLRLNTPQDPFSVKA